VNQLVGSSGSRHPTPSGRTCQPLYAGTEVVEFSPTKLLQNTLAVVEKNMAEAG
jgi:hypothetical protein